MLLFNKFFLIAQVLRLAPPPPPPPGKRSLQVLCPGGLHYETVNNVFWKSKDYNTMMSRQEL